MDRTKSIVGQKVVIYNSNNKILILKRSMTSNGAGNRDLPGGGILLHETPLECVEREIMEETGLRIKGIQPIHTHAKTYPDGSHAFFVGYRGIVDSGSEVVLSDEHDAYLRIDPNDVEKYKLQEYRRETVEKSMK